MPKTTPKSEAAEDKRWDGKQAPKYARCDLSAEQRELLKQWSSELEDVDLLKWIETEVSRGHVLSIRSNEVGYQASLTGVREASGHFGVTLIGRASTAVRAVQSLMYRDAMVLSGVWPATDSNSELDF